MPVLFQYHASKLELLCFLLSQWRFLFCFINFSDKSLLGLLLHISRVTRKKPEDSCSFLLLQRLGVNATENPSVDGGESNALL